MDPRSQVSVPVDRLEKLLEALIGTVLFFALSGTWAYNVSEMVVKNTGIMAINGCPTFIGHLAHTLVFLIFIFAIYSLINYWKDKSQQKNYWKIFKKSINASLLFYLISNKELYMLTDKIKYIDYADDKGCPTVNGSIIHSLVYMALLYSPLFI